MASRRGDTRSAVATDGPGPEVSTGATHVAANVARMQIRIELTPSFRRTGESPYRHRTHMNTGLKRGKPGSGAGQHSQIVPARGPQLCNDRVTCQPYCFLLSSRAGLV